MHRSKPLVLGCDGIKGTGVERRPLCNVRGIKRENRVYIIRGSLGDVVILDVVAHATLRTGLIMSERTWGERRVDGPT